MGLCLQNLEMALLKSEIIFLEIDLMGAKNRGFSAYFKKCEYSFQTKCSQDG
jgi:hypothetical protein